MLIGIVKARKVAYQGNSYNAFKHVFGLSWPIIREPYILLLC